MSAQTLEKSVNARLSKPSACLEVVKRAVSLRATMAARGWRKCLGSLCLAQETFQDDGTFLILYHDDDQATGSHY